MNYQSLWDNSIKFWDMGWSPQRKSTNSFTFSKSSGQRSWIQDLVKITSFSYRMSFLFCFSSLSPSFPPSLPVCLSLSFRFFFFFFFCHLLPLFLLFPPSHIFCLIACKYVNINILKGIHELVWMDPQWRHPPRACLAWFPYQLSVTLTLPSQIQNFENYHFTI